MIPREPDSATRPARWFTRTVAGIVLATFLSDLGHEMATAALPLYLGALGLGAAALGFVEGLADLLYSLSKLAGGWLGHRLERKRPLASLGYLVTALGTAALALATTALGLLTARAVAWIGRGVRAPLRDFLLADEVSATHFGRAYGLERAADMLGAVAGPLVAAGLLWTGLGAREILVASLLPSLCAAATFFLWTRDRPGAPRATAAQGDVPRVPLPRHFWTFVAGVGLFGLGDFSRTFLILLVVTAAGWPLAVQGGAAPGTLSIAVLLYAAHNLVSAAAAYPAGRLGDRTSKRRILLAGYGLGVLTNLLLGLGSEKLPLLAVAIVLSGAYVAIEETLEKAVVAELLPREQRSLGLGVLAAANAAGDMVASLMLGLLLARGQAQLAFFLAAGFGLAGVAWLACCTSPGQDRSTAPASGSGAA